MTAPIGMTSPPNDLPTSKISGMASSCSPAKTRPVRCGLEWLHRLCSEPRRLWKRYLVTNTLFTLGAIRQLLRGPEKTDGI